MNDILWALAGTVIVFIVVSVSVLVLVLLERKFLGHLQQRYGPMRVGPHGVLQTLADALKLLLKEDFVPASADRLLFQIAPFLVFVPVFLTFVTIPFSKGLVIRNLDLGLFYLMAVPVVSAVGFFVAGWASGNKYALLGGVRYAGVLISYELPMLVGVISVAMVTGTLDLTKIVELQREWPLLLAQLPAFLIFVFGGMVESNRTPFDISFAESEIVGGPFVEYSGMRWALFFLAEYAAVFSTSAATTLIFLGGWNGPLLPPIVWFFIKTYAIIIFIFWMRGTMPRLRVDQLMLFSWKGLVPLAFLNFVVTGFTVLAGGTSPGSATAIAGGLLTTAVSFAILSAAFRTRRHDDRIGAGQGAGNDLRDVAPAPGHNPIP